MTDSNQLPPAQMAASNLEPCTLSTHDATPSWDNESFSAHVRHTRQEINDRDQRFRVWNQIQQVYPVPDGLKVWYDKALYYVMIVGCPGTLGGDILERKCDLPRYDCHLKIVDDKVYNTWQATPPYGFAGDAEDPDLEDCSATVAQLPLITPIDPNKHYTKKPKYISEILNLLACVGAPRIIQLLGRSDNDQLVFPRYKRDIRFMIHTNPDDRRIQNIKKWMLDAIAAVENLHSRGIVYRDIVTRNILEAEPLVLCDLECKNADYHCKAFELDDDHAGVGYTFETDVFALGALVWEMCFLDCAPSRAVLLDNPPPPPFRDIFLACTRVDPGDRPTLEALRSMYEAI